MRLTPKELGLIIGTLLACSATARAATAPQFALQAVMVNAPPKLDGTLNDPAWQKAAHVELGWDFTYRRPAEERTDAYLLIDKNSLYVGFSVQQSEAVTATQHTNDVPLGADDVVRIYLWPGGDRGFEYGFISNPIGTRYEFSSENSAFAPAWEAAGKPSAHGYTVTERIPLDVMRGDGRGTWRIQFDRRVEATNTLYEWSHADAQGGTDSILYTGYLSGMELVAKGARTKPRLQLYTLGEAASNAAGGSTSRVGADFAIPITSTASFLGTIHPDYSNVELDQQTIAPTAFPRRFQEVRPFFTQGQQFYNAFNCNDCVDFPLLYTPAIPTPRDGYAIEGSQGPATFGAFDALSSQRSDSAQSLQFVSSDRRFQALVQRETVDYPGVHDDATYAQAIVGNAHNFNAYVTEGAESGTFITQPGAGAYREYGVNFYTPKSGLFAAYHDIGSQYGPVDAFNAYNDVRGPSVYVFREFDFGQKKFVQNVTISQDYDRYFSHAGGLDFGNNSSALTVNTRTLFTLSLSTGENYILQGAGPGGFANQNGFSLSYAQNTSTPSSYSYNVGRFGAGYLRSSLRSTTLKAGHRGTLTLEADDTSWSLDGGSTVRQWLERVSYALQLSGGSSFAIGARRIIGTGPTFFQAPQYVDASNVSLAYYRRVGTGELYLVYGDPNALYTTPALIAKWIFYIGAQKGT